MLSKKPFRNVGYDSLLKRGMLNLNTRDMEKCTGKNILIYYDALLHLTYCIQSMKVLFYQVVHKQHHMLSAGLKASDTTDRNLSMLSNKLTDGNKC